MSSWEEYKKKRKEENSFEKYKNERENTSQNQTTQNSNINTQKNESLWDKIVNRSNFLLGVTSGVKSSFNFAYKTGENKRYTQQQLEAQRVIGSKELTNQEKDIFLMMQKGTAKKADTNPILSINNTQYDEQKIKQIASESVLDKSIREDQEQIQKNIEETQNPVLRKLRELAPSIGNMGVGAVISAINPVAGTAYFTTSAGGSYMQDALSRGMTQEEATTYGAIMGLVEGGTELIGLQNFSKAGKAVKTLITGAGKEVVEQSSKSLVKEALKNYAIGMADNAIQEAIIGPIQEFTAGAIGGKDKAQWEGIGQRMLEDAVNGALVSAVIGGANLGIQSCTGLVQKVRNNEQITQQEFETAVKDASKKVDVPTIMEENVQSEIAKQQNTINQQQVQTQQVEQQITTENMQNNANKLNEIIKNDKYLSAEDKQAMQYATNVLLQNGQLTSQDTLDIIQQIKQMSETAQKENASLDVGKKYMTGRKEIYNKYSKVQEYDNTAVQQAKNTVPSNSQGKRTKEQWLQVAKQIGTNVANMSDSEIQKIAYKSWQDEAPNTTATLNRQGKKYVKFTSDDWIDAIYDQVKSVREITGYKASNDTLTQLDNFANELKQQQAQPQTQKATVDTSNMNLIDSAKAYNIDSNSETVQTINKTLAERGIKSRFDESLFTDSNGNINKDTNAIWRTTTDADGNIQREVIFNPFADTEKTMQQVSIHELLHDFEGTQEFNELTSLILDKNKTRKGYTEARKQLEDIYAQIYDKNSKEFMDLVNEEELADTLAQKLGDQDFINSLNTQKPTVFRKIYNWIVDKLNKLTGSSNEKLYWQNIRNKFESAYKQEYQGNKVDQKYSKVQAPTKDNLGNTLSKEQQEFFKDSQIRDKDGNLKVMYHGTKRADRVGNIFDPEKATSGPMAFFTENKDIATNYSRDKQDTSLSREYTTEYDLFKANGKDLDTYWNSLSEKQKDKIRENANNVGFDDDFENIQYGKNASENSFGDQYKWRLKNEYKGNAIKALYSVWIEDGNLMDTDIAKFKEVLELSGVDNIDYLDIFKEDPKVYEVLLNIKKPFDTSNMSEDIINQFKEASKTAKVGEQYSADLWDKSNITPEAWIEKLDNDIENNTAHAWTVIPDWVTDVLKKNGYDGIRDTGGKMGGQEHEVIIPFYSEQIKNIDNKTPTTSPDIRYSTQQGGAWQDFLNEQIGTTGKGKTVQQLKLPTKETINKTTSKSDPYTVLYKNNNTVDKQTINLPTQEGLKQRKTYKSIIESDNTSPEAKAIAKELIGSDSYIPDSNENQLKVADEEIGNRGPDTVAENFANKLSKGDKITANDIAIGERLIEYYSKTGEKEKLQDVIQNVALAGTQAGQAVQAMSLISKQTPQGQAVYIEKVVHNLNKAIEERTNGKGKQFNLTPEMLDKITNSTDKNLEANVTEVAMELAKQVPKTTIEKIDSWRYFSMLANPRTHIRNIIGNFSMAGVQTIKNKVAGGLEAVAQKTGMIDERTKTLKPASREVKKFAKNDTNNVMARLNNESKFDAKNIIQQYQRTFKSDLLENTLGKLYNLNSKALEAEDIFGLKRGYEKAMSDYMTANNLTVDYITSGTREADIQLEKARKYAIEQAQEATFHQQSAMSSMLARFENKNTATKLLIGAVLPFKKTPINVAKTGASYSPLGLVKAFTYDVSQLNKGNITATQYIDNLAKGLTGTGIATLGYALAQAGILSASGDDDDSKKEWYSEDRGEQPFSIKIGEKTYSLDWLSPTAIPLFIGAEINRNVKDVTGENETVTEDVLERLSTGIDGMTKALNPMVEMSMLSGLASTISSFAQGDTQVFSNLLINSAKSYVNQFFPTLGGQIAKTIDTTERTTTSTKKNTLAKAIDSTGRQILNKIPFASQLLPAKTDVWGNTLQRDSNPLYRALQQSIFPWTEKSLKSTVVDNSISDLYEETGENSVLPNTSINKDFTINSEKYRLTAEEYAQYKKEYGKTSYNLLNSLVTSKEYKNMTSEQKTKAISEIYSYANENNKMNYAEQNGITNVKPSTTYTTIQSIKEAGGKESDYFKYLGSTLGVEETKDKMNVLEELNISNNSKSAIYSNTLGKQDDLYNLVLSTSKIDINEYLGYKQQEFTSDKKDDGTVEGKTITNSKKTKVYDYVNNMDITRTQKILILGKSYKLNRDEQEVLYNYINNIQGQTKQEKLDIFSDYSSNFTVYKNGKISYK